MTLPLAGLTVIVARDDAPDDDVSAAIIAAGGTVVPLPLMRVVPPLDVRPLHDAVSQLADPAPWAAIVFTSRHAVAAVATQAPAPTDVVVAAVGDATARALQGLGWPVHVVGDGGGAVLAARLVAAVDLAGRRVLWPRAEDAHDGLRPALEAAGATVDDVVAYRAVAVVDAARVASACASQRPLALVVTSPRRVRVLAAAAPIPADVAIVAIGQTTADAARAVGLAVAATAAGPGPGPVCTALAALHTPT